MSDFTKRLLGFFSAPPHHLEKEAQLAEEVKALYDKSIKKATRECNLRLAAAGAVTIHGMVGLRHNTGRHLDWALFTALVGFVFVALIVLWHWQLQTKLTIQREIKQLRLEVNMLLEQRKT